MDFFNILFNQKFGGHTGDFIDQLFAANLGPTEKTVSGSIASFSDGANDVPVTDLLVDIDPIQDLNGQDAPYPAGGGANIWDEEWEVGALNENGNPIASNAIRSKNYIPVIGGATYFEYASDNTNNWINISQYDADKVFIQQNAIYSKRTITLESNTAYIKFYMAASYGTTYNYDIAINYPSTVTTYAPYSNICPISGWTGAVVSRTGINVWDEEWELGYINPTTGAEEADSNKIRMKNYISIKPNTQYFKVAPFGFWNVYYDAEKNYIGYSDLNPNSVFTTPSNAYYMRSGFERNYGTTYNHDISINYPSTDTSYHAYNGNTYTTTLGRTVYGGTLDVVSGELIIDRAMVVLDENADIGGFYADNTNNNRITWVPFSTVGKINAPILSDSLKTVMAPSDETWAIGYNSSGASRAFIYVPKSITSIADFQTWLSQNPIQLCYELATPLTYQLSETEVRTLLGDNNIWADTGDTTVTYKTKGR